MDVRENSCQVSNKNVEHSLETGGKVILLYRKCQGTCVICILSVLWKMKHNNNKTVLIVEEIFKQIVEVVTGFLLITYGKMQKMR
jgi:hypothetical protein